MKRVRGPAIIISSYYHLSEVLDQPGIGHVVSILGRTDRLAWPGFGTRRVVRLEFDDTYATSRDWVAPGLDHIERIIHFAREWDGEDSLLVHCRAGSSRSVAAGLISASAIGRSDVAVHLIAGKSYFRPNRRMLELADSLISPSPDLVSLARFLPVPARTDDWGPVWIPLGAPAPP